MKRKTGKWATLDGVLDEIWVMLQSGVAHFNDPFHCPVLGTTGAHGVSLRTVILRKLILPDRILVCHTDSRAPKVREIRDYGRVGWLFYHPKRKVQLRITGHATCHADDGFAQDQWAATRLTSRLNYCAEHPPGTALDAPSSGLPDFLKNKVPTLLESERGRSHFVAIACRIDSIDWLLLSVLGNRRARFVWENDRLTSTWLVP